MPLFPSEPAGGAGTPGGSNTQVQFNNSSVFGGDAGFTYAGTGQVAIANSTANTPALAITGGSLTGSSTQGFLTVTGTWNTTGVVDAAILANITNTASGAASKLIDLQVGGASKLNVDKAGIVTSAGAVNASNGNFGTAVANLGGAGQLACSGAIFVANNGSGTSSFVLGTVGGHLTIASTNELQWASTANAQGTMDTFLRRNAAATIQFGTADAAAPVAQTTQVQSVVAGTTNTAGVNWTLKGSLSTGSGTSGDIILQTGGTGAGATAQNTATTALTLKGGTQRTVCSAPLGMKGYTVATLPAGVTGDNAYVTDALAPSFLVTIAGGGSVVTPVFYNGTNWVGA